MEFEFIIDNKQYSVKAEKKGNPSSQSDEYTATVDNRSLTFSSTWVSANSVVLSSGALIQKVYVAATDDRIFVHIQGKVVTLHQVLADQKVVSKELMEFGSKDQVSTPMPGKIVKILVNVGDRVEFKQPIVIVESMKMENEIKSPSGGTIKSIHFLAGDLVETGQPIIKIEPD